MRWISLLAIAACSSAVNGPISNTGANSTADLEAALRDDAPIDYERPFIAKPYDRATTRRRYAEACEHGMPEACIVTAQLAPKDKTGSSFHAVETNCLSGDAMSCRALPEDEDAPRFPRAPGAMSRSAACQSRGLPSPCSPALLRRECLDGFPMACLRGRDLEKPGEDFWDRWHRLSLSVCRAGSARDCDPATKVEPVEAARRLCDLRRDRCDRLADAYAETRDRDGQRHALELACEYGNKESCVELATAYLDHTLDEPMSGRGQALLVWACQALARDSLVERYPACGRVTP